MITDQKTIDALKELNYSQVYEKGKEDARQEILDKIDKLIKSSKEDGLLYPKYRPSIEAYLEVLKDYIKKLNQPKTEQ